MADSINILVPKEAIDSIIATDKAITSLDIVYRRLLTTVEDGKKTLSDAAITQDKLNEAGKKAKETSDQLDAASKKLAASEKALSDFDKEKYAATLKNSQALKDQQKEILEMVKAESLEKGSIAALRAENAKLAKERDHTTTLTEEGRKKILQLNTAIDKNTETIRGNSDAAGKQRMNIGNYKSALEGLPGPLGAAAGGITKVDGTMKKLAANPIALVLVLITGALMAMYKAFKATDDGATEREARFAQLGAILKVLANRVSSLIEGFGQLFSGHFKAAGEAFKSTVTGIGAELKGAASAAYEFVYAMDALQERQVAFISEEAKMNNQIEKLLNLSKDQRKSDTERMNALESALGLEKTLADKKREFAEAEFDLNTKKLASIGQISAEELKAFIQLNEQEQTDAKKSNSKLANAWNLLGDEKIKSLEDYYAKAVNADTEYYRSTKRAISSFSALSEELKRDRIAKNKEAKDRILKDTIEEIEAMAKMAEEDKNTRIDNILKANSEIAAARDAELLAVNQAYIDGTISFEKAEQQKLAIARKYEYLILQESLKALEGQAGELTPGKQAEAAAKIAAKKLEIAEQSAKEQYEAKKYWDDLAMADLEADEKAAEDLRKKREEAEKEAEQTKRDLIQGTADLVNEIGNTIFEVQNNHIEAEIDNINRKRDTELEAAEGSKSEIAKINDKYDKLEKAQKEKQWKNDRAAALFQIAIGTAVGVVKALETPPPAGFILAGIVGAIGALQAGVVLSKELPKFAKGTRGQYNTPDAFLAGEAGTEWIEKKSGEMAEVSKPTVFRNARGMRVWSNPEIQQMNRMMVNNHANFDMEEIKALRRSNENSLSRIESALSNQRQYIYQDGKAIGYKHKNSTRKYIERMIG